MQGGLRFAGPQSDAAFWVPREVLFTALKVTWWEPASGPIDARLGPLPMRRGTEPGRTPSCPREVPAMRCRRHGPRSGPERPLLGGGTAMAVPTPIWGDFRDFISNDIFVNSTFDVPDANPGDGIVDDGSGNVNVRAAIQELDRPGNTAIIFLPSGHYAICAWRPADIPLRRVDSRSRRESLP